MSADETAVQLIRAGSAVAVVFMIIFLVSDLWSVPAVSFSGTILHGLGILATLAFFAATFTAGFHLHWKLWNLLFAILLLSIFVLISAQTQESDSRYIALLLYPVATGAFVNWEWQWQTLLGLACVTLYGIAEDLCPPAGCFASSMVGAVRGDGAGRLYVIVYRSLPLAHRRAD